MLAKIKKLPRYLVKTAALFSLFFLIGCLLSMLIKATPGEGNLTSSSFENLKTIALKNCLLIVTVYLSVIFTKVYGYGVCCINGLILGLTCGWIVQTNIRLLLLLLPHGIFEIPNILATGYILSRNEESIRKNIKGYAAVLGAHLLFTLFCAVIEVFITPLFQVFV